MPRVAPREVGDHREEKKDAGYTARAVLIEVELVEQPLQDLHNNVSGSTGESGPAGFY